jgi:hypothetical protein
MFRLFKDEKTFEVKATDARARQETESLGKLFVRHLVYLRPR